MEICKKKKKKENGGFDFFLVFEFFKKYLGRIIPRKMSLSTM